MASALTLPAPGLKPVNLAMASEAAAAKLSPAVNVKAKAAAQKFEAAFLNTIFQEMFTDIGGEGPFGGAGATGVWRSFLTDAYAKSFAKAGGIGIADHVYRSLIAHQAAAS
ncbi:MAG TPA: flagellar assembly peptidoglycan hydrolase FlgJ [Pseudolabrys sp.]|nr:flagellar assembly peptidoglycan hydrolase FlgJ [Pseudolabrys sp.]